MQPLMDQLIAPFQSVFINSRNVHENVLLAIKIIHRKHFGKLQRWTFIKLMIAIMGFLGGSLAQNEFSSFTDSFGYVMCHITPHKSLRQGDLLSPYLFILCSNVLSYMLIQRERAHLDSWY